MRLYVLFRLLFEFTLEYLESVRATISLYLCRILFWEQLQLGLHCREDLWVALSWQFSSWWGCCLFDILTITIHFIFAFKLEQSNTYMYNKGPGGSKRFSPITVLFFFQSGIWQLTINIPKVVFKGLHVLHCGRYILTIDKLHAAIIFISLLIFFLVDYALWSSFWCMHVHVCIFICTFLFS